MTFNDWWSENEYEWVSSRDLASAAWNSAINGINDGYSRGRYEALKDAMAAIEAHNILLTTEQRIKLCSYIQTVLIDKMS